MDYQLGPGPLQADQDIIDEKIKSDIGIVENGDVATHAITKGYYVIWKGDLYIAKTDISSGTTLSAASNGNLTAKPSGLGAEVAALNSKITRKEYQFGNLAFDAGEVGTRGLQTSVNITNDLNAYGTLISLLITLVSDSSKSHFQVFGYSNTIVLNGYRATANAMTNNSVFVLATYMKD